MGTVGQSALSGAAQGASMGMTFGPWGAAIGAVGGGIYGYYQGEQLEEEAKIEQKKVETDNTRGRLLAQQASSQSQHDSYNNNAFSSISGADSLPMSHYNTLPMSDPTQLRPGTEPQQQTQMNQQVQALGLG
tara:strand:+ start:215 stop:610 length:396 start_codon:yes stop_codon:yes gene_type:complete